jgi:hypothetical protein
MSWKPGFDPRPGQISIGPKATGSGLFEESGGSAAREDIAARPKRIVLAPFGFLLSWTFMPGLGHDEEIVAATGERISHTRCFIDICRRPSR